jgi:hypothetical protein
VETKNVLAVAHLKEGDAKIVQKIANVALTVNAEKEVQQLVLSQTLEHALALRKRSKEVNSFISIP